MVQIYWEKKGRYRLDVRAISIGCTLSSRQFKRGLLRGSTKPVMLHEFTRYAVLIAQIPRPGWIALRMERRKRLRVRFCPAKGAKIMRFSFVCCLGRG